MRRFAVVTGVVAAFLASVSAFGQVGVPLPKAELEDLAQTKARTFDEYQGRLVLLEFFAYW